MVSIVCCMVFPTHVGVFLVIDFLSWVAGSLPHARGGVSRVRTVGARLKLTTCAGLKLTRCYSGVDYYAAVDKSTRL